MRPKDRTLWFNFSWLFWNNHGIICPILAQNEANFRLSREDVETSHTQEITTFVRLHRQFSEQLTASCGAQSAKWMQRPSELKGFRILSYAWNHVICSAPHVIFKTTYSFLWCSKRKMKAISAWAERLQNPFIRMKSQYFPLHMWFSEQLTASCGALSAKWRQHPLELKGCWRLSNTWNHNICSAAHVIFKATYNFMWRSTCKIKTKSAWAERLQEPLICMKPQYFLGCTCDF